MEPAMAEWYENRAEELGVSPKELVTHALLEYREQFEDSEDTK
jgi:hypothetical protein